MVQHKKGKCQQKSSCQVAALGPGLLPGAPSPGRTRSAPAQPGHPGRLGPALQAATVRAAGVSGQGLPHPRNTIRAPMVMISEEGKGIAQRLGLSASLSLSHALGLSRWQGPGTQWGMTQRRPNSRGCVFPRQADGETALPRGFIPCGSSAKKVEESGPTFEMVGYLQTFLPRGPLKVKPAPRPPHPPTPRAPAKALALAGHPGLTG